jgi:transcriptional regulator with XRE-family HTH domain
VRESFGDRLRRQREERRIDLVTVAARTKIKQSLLDGLERGDLSDWPSDFYRRSFIRAYASAIGLDPDVVLQEFLTGATDAPDDAGTPVVAHAPLVNRAAPPESPPDLLAVAALCTEFGRVEHAAALQPLLRDAANLLGAVGLIVWLWDQRAGELRPALSHGYTDKMLAQMPAMGRDADNATADAFRSAESRTIIGGDHATGALVIPLRTPAECAGVLAIELQAGREPSRSACATATILAALLAQLFAGPVPEDEQLRHVAGSGSR